MTDHLSAALKLASKGVPVFPVGPDKRPRTSNGFKDGSTDYGQIRDWNWNSGGMVGACIPEGQVIIDVDPRNGGMETWEALKAGHTLPSTRTVSTMNDGYHYYFKVEPGVKLRSTLGPGVDVKNAGKGYVIVPPSAGYEYIEFGEPAPAPDWLVDELRVEATRETSAVSGPVKFFDEFQQGSTYGVSGMQQELDKLGRTLEGGRNNALNAAAYSLAQLAAGGELKEEAAIRELERVAAEIGLGEQEIQGTIKSGWAEGLKNPRQAPERAKAVVPALAESPELVEEEGEEPLWFDWDSEPMEIPFYLENLIPESGYVLVFGGTGVGKSMIWFGLLAQASNLGVKCSVYSFENTKGTDSSRLRRMRPNREHFRISKRELDLFKESHIRNLIEYEKEWGTQVIIIDTYSHAHNSQSEDGNAVAIEFARRVRKIMREVGCTVILVDHTGYQQTNEPRGSSAKRQQVDTAFLVEAIRPKTDRHSPQFSITSKKSSRFDNDCRYVVEVADTKDGDLDIRFVGEAPKWQI